MATQKTPKQLADEQRRDVLAYAYRDTDGKLYALNASGDLVPAPAGAKALPADSQKDAEQFAAILMMRAKVLALNPEDKSIFTQIMNGQRKVDETLTSGVREAVDAFKKTTGLSLEIPGAATARAVGSGLSVLPSFISETWDAAGNFLSQLGGGQISREVAIAAGAAYGSARQVAKDERPSFTDGLLSKNFFSFAFAGLKYLVDLAMGFAEKLPMVGDFIKEKGWHSGKSLAQFVEEGSREADNERVAHEMTKLKKIGGLDSTELAGLATRGGVVRTHDGRQVTVAAADAASSAPHAQGATLPAGVDAAAAERKANGKGLLDRLKMAAGEADYSKTNENAQTAGGLGTTLGVATVAAGGYQGVRGAVEGFARRVVERPDKVEQATRKAAEELASKIKAAEAAPKTAGWQFWRTSPEQLQTMRTQLTGLQEQMVVDSRAAQSMSANASPFMQRAVTPISQLHDSKIVRGLAYITQGVGRVAGEVTGMVTNAGTSIAKTLGLKSVDVVRGTVNTASEIRGAASAIVESGTARAVSLYAAPVIETGSFAIASLNGDQRGIEKGMWATGTIAASVAAGAGAGALIGGVGAIPGAIAGLIAGSFTALVASHQAGKRYDARMESEKAAAVPAPAKQAQAEGTLGALDKGIALAIQQTDTARVAAAQSDALDRLRMATAVGRTGGNRKAGLVNFNLGIANSDVKLGSTVTALATPTGASTNNARTGETPVAVG